MYYIHENKIEKNIDHKNFLQNAKQEFSCQSLESFSGKYYNMENKILHFHVEPVCAKQTREAEIQSSDGVHKNGCNCEKCEKMPTS